MPKRNNTLSTPATSSSTSTASSTSSVSSSALLPAISHTKKFYYSVIMSSVAGVYSAFIPTLGGRLLGECVLGMNLKNNKLIYDMEISAVTMATFCMLSYPYQYSRNLPGFEQLMTRYLFLSALIFVMVPFSLPILINKMLQDEDFDEFYPLLVGGLLAQLLALIAIVISIEIVDRNENVVKAIEFLVDVVIPEADKVYFCNVHNHRYVHHRTNARQVLLNSITQTSTTLAKKIKSTFNSANAKTSIRRVKLAMLQPTLKYFLKKWYDEKRDPASKYLLHKLSRSYADDSQDLEEYFTSLENKFEQQSGALYDNAREFAIRERNYLLWFEIELGKQNNLFAMKMVQAAMLEKALAARQHILHDPIEEEKTKLEEIKQENPLTILNTSNEKAEELEEKKNNDLVINNADNNLLRAKQENIQDKEEVKENVEEKKTELPTNLLNTYTLPSAPTSAPTHAPSLAKLPTTPNKAAFFQPQVTSMKPIKLDVPLKIPLTNLEKKIFALLDLLVDGSNQYITYIVGGRAYDKVREFEKGIPPCEYNDFDLVTTIPPHLLKTASLKASSYVKGLFTGNWFNTQIEIMYESDLSDLLVNAKKRDYMTFYIDKFGNVFDPTKQELLHLRRGCLYTPRLPDIMFQEDPLMILRGIYKANKRMLNFDDFKSQIKADRMSLLTGLMNTIHPHVMNLCVAKLFSQYLASESLENLYDLDLFEVLFPTIHYHMVSGIEWIRERIAVSSQFPWPKLAMIYATFIAPTIVQQNPHLLFILNETEDNGKDQNIFEVVNQIRDSSPLFIDAFTDSDELYSYLREPLSAYYQFSISNNILLQNESIISFPIIPSLNFFSYPSTLAPNLATIPILQSDGSITFSAIYNDGSITDDTQPYPFMQSDSTMTYPMDPSVLASYATMRF